MAHDDPKHPRKNPHPVQRYEVIATADAPGPWDSVKGYVSFGVTNVNCVPRDPFSGARNVPNTDFEFEMTKVGPNTWKGYFYRDALQDENYFGLGICHWDATQASPVFAVHGETFTAGALLQKALQTGSQTSYFKKNVYLDSAFRGDGALEFSPASPEYIKNPDAFFPVTVIVKEDKP